MVPHGQFVWNELRTSDLGKAKDFYGKTLGWTFEPMDMGNGMTYWLIKNGGEAAIGGMTDVMAGQAPDGWFAFVETDDVDKRVALIAAAGGKILGEPFDVPGVGRIAMLEDPTGAQSGWITSVER